MGPSPGHLDLQDRETFFIVVKAELRASCSVLQDEKLHAQERSIRFCSRESNSMAKEWVHGLVAESVEFYGRLVRSSNSSLDPFLHEMFPVRWERDVFGVRLLRCERRESHDLTRVGHSGREANAAHMSRQLFGTTLRGRARNCSLQRLGGGDACQRFVGVFESTLPSTRTRARCRALTEGAHFLNGSL